MAALDPSVKEVDVESPDVPAASLIAAAAARPLVVVVRDLHRIDWHASVVAALAAARPDLVVVEMGVPIQRPYGVRGYVATYGAARVNGEAAAQVLLPRRS
jgi:beta-N-acetylhexosaminidase